MTVLGKAPGGAPIGVRSKNCDVGAALRRLNDMVEAMAETPGPPCGIAQDGVYALARVYGEALSVVVRRLGGTTEATVVHELRPDSCGGRALRIIARLGHPSKDRGGRAELATLEATMPMLQLRRCGSESPSVAEIVRDAVLAAVPELSSVTVVFGAESSSAMEPPETPTVRPTATIARL